MSDTKSQEEKNMYTGVFINNNVPPHETLIKDGNGNIAGTILGISGFTVVNGLPVKDKVYNIHHDQGEIKSKKCLGASAQMIAFHM